MATNKLIIAIKRNLKQFGTSIWRGFTVTGTIFGFILFFVPEIIHYHLTIGFVVFILSTLIIALIEIYPTESISFKLKNTNTAIGIKFGNIFKESSNIAIPVNEYFDSEIGKIVAKTSIHGQFIIETLKGKSELFDESVKKSFENIPPEVKVRENGKSHIYPIGSTAVLRFKKKQYLLFALTKTNDKYEAHTTPSLLMKSLDGLFEKARSVCNGEELNMPLIGTGLSRTGIPSKHVLELILIAILKATKEKEITDKINIIISDEWFKEIDLKSIKKEWN